jgi:ferritin
VYILVKSKAASFPDAVINKEKMMIGKKMEKALNEQINKEIYSAYLYLSMSAYSARIGLSGFSNWFKVQYKEELEHAEKLFDYIHEHGNEVKLAAIEQPPADFKSPVALFEQSLKHEQFVTRSIHSLVDLAIAEKDHATNGFLQWFVKEQVEEEANATEILTKLQMVGDKNQGLLMVDAKLAARKFEAD